jgi:sirohydrochlorin cobaltochelatase
MLILLLTAVNATASGKTATDSSKTAIVIASFGTTVPTAIKAIINIIDKTKARYPNTEVRVTFTSNIIRSVWNKRQTEAQQWLDDGIPREILFVKNIISTIGDLREEGYRNIIVQPTHMFYMEQSQDLQSYVDGLASISTTKEKWRPFDALVMGRPALGMPGDRYSYHKDVATAVATLAKDAARAQKERATLVYMGHGNDYWSTGIYAETQKKMNDVYPEVTTIIGVVEGMPSIEDVLEQLKDTDTKKVILKPFMIVAGNHATNDMAGPGANSWKSILTAAGYEVEAVMEGLGSNDAFAEIFVDHIKDTADENGIILQ